jgi:GNAT superfamily N-acetyltransferase
MEGPRGLLAGELGSLRELTDVVMRPGLVDQFPHLFDEENHDNLRVCLDAGRCVSHVGMIQRDASLFGCRVRVGCIGAVSTHPDYRRRGLASACFDDALRKAGQDGVDLMIVSGDRSLYRMRGCVHVGGDTVFTITADSTAVVSSQQSDRTRLTADHCPLTAGLTVELMTDAELPLVMECYRREPVRFMRPPGDYLHALRSGWVMNRRSEFLVLRERGEFRGYVIAPRAEPDGSARLAELAGDRRVVLAALPAILRRNGLASLQFQVMRHDRLLQSLCEQAGLAGVSRSTPGTVTLINFPQLMERLRPYLEERLGARTATALRFAWEDSQGVFAFGSEAIRVSRHLAARMLFGTPAGLPEPLPDLGGSLGEALRAVLPVPTLWYGVNYV